MSNKDWNIRRIRRDTMIGTRIHVSTPKTHANAEECGMFESQRTKHKRDEKWLKQYNAYREAIERIPKPRVRVLVFRKYDAFIKQVSDDWMNHPWVMWLNKAQPAGIQLVQSRRTKHNWLDVQKYRTGVFVTTTKLMVDHLGKHRRIYRIAQGDLVIRVDNELIRIQMV